MSDESLKISISTLEETISNLKKELDKLYIKTIQALAEIMPECVKNEIDRRIDLCWREVKKLNDSGELTKLKTFVKTYLENVHDRTLGLSKSESSYPHSFKPSEYQNQNSNQMDQDVNYIFKHTLKDLDSNLASFGLLRENRANRVDYPDGSDVFNFKSVATIEKIEKLEKAVEKYKLSFSSFIKKCDELRQLKVQLEKDEVMKSWNDGKI